MLRSNELLEVNKHRPYPLPQQPWLISQQFCDTLFMHWRTGYEQLKRYMPVGLMPDEIDGSAWVSIAALHIRGNRLRLAPPFPGLLRWAQINVRTYVTRNEKPGVFFLHIDANHRWIALAARTFFAAPYNDAPVVWRRRGQWLKYDVNGQFGCQAMVGELKQTAKGSIEHALIERYCMYTASSGGQLYRSDLHHIPWQMQEAEIEITHNHYLAGLGIDGRKPELTSFCESQPSLLWANRRIRKS